MVTRAKFASDCAMLSLLVDVTSLALSKLVYFLAPHTLDSHDACVEGPAQWRVSTYEHLDVPRWTHLPE